VSNVQDLAGSLFFRFSPRRDVPFYETIWIGGPLEALRLRTRKRSSSLVRFTTVNAFLPCESFSLPCQTGVTRPPVLLCFAPACSRPMFHPLFPPPARFLSRPRFFKKSWLLRGSACVLYFNNSVCCFSLFSTSRLS